MFAQFSLPQQHRRITYQNKKAKPRDSNRRPHWSLWVRVGLHDQREQPTDRDSVLCVLGFTTNTVSNKTDRTRLHNPPQWATNNHTPKQVWSKATSKGRNIPPTCEQHRNTTQLQAWRPRHTARNQSNNITHHLGKRRSTMGNTSTRHLDIQQSRILGETPQSQAQSNIHARSTMSSSNGQTWGLQKNNSPQTRWHNRRLCRETSQPWAQSTEEGAEHSMERWNVLQGQEECKTTKATDCNTNNTKQGTTSTQSETAGTSTTEEEMHTKETREARGDGNKLGNKQWATSKQWTATTPGNKHSTAKGTSNNGRLLDPWRTSVEKSPHKAQNSTLHTTTDARWARCHQADPWKDNNRQANIRSKMAQDRRRLDNKTRSNFERPMDWLNKLWGEHLIHTKMRYMTWVKRIHNKQSQQEGLTAPAQPTQQERAEHELTHLPFRSWRPTCVANKGRADKHPKQTSKMPVVKFDFCYFKTAGEPTTTAILTGIDVETGMVMATMVGDKQQDFQYHVNCIQPFLMECGRVQAVLNSSILQSDQEDHLKALQHTAASKMGGNVTVRQSPAYSSRQRRTFPPNTDGTIQNTESPITTKLRQNNHQQASNRTMAVTTHSVSTQQIRNTCGWQHQPLSQMEQRPQNTTLWVWRNSAVPTANSQATTRDGTTFLQSHLAWKGHSNRRDTSGHQQQSCQSKNNQTHAQARQVLQTNVWRHQKNRTHRGTTTNITSTTTTTDGTPKEQVTVTRALTGGPQLPPKAIADTPMASATPASASSPMATAPTSCHSSPAMPSPPKRHLADDTAEGSSTKQQRTAAQPEAPARPEPTPEQPKSRLRTQKLQSRQNKERRLQLTPVKLQQINRPKGFSLNPSWTTPMDLTNGRQLKGWNTRFFQWSNSKSTWRLTSTLWHQNNAGTSPSHAGSSATRATQQGPSKSCRKRIHRNSDWLGWHLRVNAHFLCVENIPHTSMQQRMDWPNRRHLNCIFTCGSSNSAPLHVPAKGVLQPGGQHRMETAVSNLWTTQQSKSMAETPCGSPSTDRTSPQHSRTQHLHDRSTQLLCFGLRRRPSLPWRGTDCQQALQGDPTAFATSTNRHHVTRKHSSIPWQEHHQQRRPLWD